MNHPYLETQAVQRAAPARVVNCPICAIEWPSPVACCACGYDFTIESVHGAMARFRGARISAVTMQACGAVTIALIAPFFWLVGFTPAWLILAMFLIPIQVIGGLTMIVRGAARLRTATRHLRAARRLGQLPSARIVERRS